jgi:'Cold-shock' DNA-binding domain
LSGISGFLGFVYHTGIAGGGFKSLNEGEKVTYEVTQGRKGLQAVKMSLNKSSLRPDTENYGVREDTA